MRHLFTIRQRCEVIGCLARGTAHSETVRDLVMSNEQDLYLLHMPVELQCNGFPDHWYHVREVANACGRRKVDLAQDRSSIVGGCPVENGDVQTCLLDRLHQLIDKDER